MRILFAGDRPGYPQRMTGAAVSTHLLADLLGRNGASAHILCGLPADAAAEAESDNRLSYTIDRAADPVAAVPETVTVFSPDVAVLTSGATFALARALVEHRVPLVVYQRDLGFSLLQDLTAEMVAAPIGVFACSRFVAHSLTRNTGLDAVFLPNVFPREIYETPATGGMVTLINPVPAKGVELVLDLAARHRDLPFLFVEGWALPPKQRSVLQGRAARTGNIRWHPRVADMRQVYARTRLLLVPSRWKEAWGRVVTEAQISGIPVLASDHGGLPESVGAGGYLLPVDDLDAWSDHLVRIMTNDSAWAALSAQASAHARREELEPNRIVAQFICQIRDWLQQVKDGRAG
ncbi:glycosyltransferase [Hwanghaeella sp.]|uniref:glycosyltransferase n=1 Tax=Hwanghaeella sp. TaxID=2605943 RepID=UPI003CCBDFBC